MSPTRKSRAYVVGVGMTKFEKPGRRDDFDYPEMAREAVTKALLDSGLRYDQVEQAFVGYCYGDSTCGQRAVYPLGLTQIPVINVNNNCATGSTALFLARQAVEGGMSDCCMALGFEKMQPGSLGQIWKDRTSAMSKFFKVMRESRGVDAKAPGAPQIFGNAGLEHMEKYGTTEDHFAKIGWKNHKHSTLNPYSQFREEYSLDQVKNGRKVFKYLSLLQCCPTSDGAGCAIVASEKFVRDHKLEGLAVEIVSQSMTTDSPNAFNKSSIELAGADMTRRAAAEVFKSAGVKPSDVQVIELHDCFSANELITYEALGLCGEGEAGKMIDANDNTFGGKYVVNPSGGLISKGHPLGATGLAQCCELTWQVRGWCDKRQVSNVKYALQHNIGLGGAVVVSLYKKGFPNVATPLPKLGYNPAVECRPVTEDDVARVRSLDGQVSPMFAAGSSVAVPGFQSSALFEQIRAGLESVDKQSIAKQVKGIFQFDVKNAEGKVQVWTLNLKDNVEIVAGTTASKADIVIAIADQDFVDMSNGKLNGQKAFMQGKIKVKGKMMLATKLDAVLKQAKQAKL